ncbi:hypothetical protein LTR62_005100 [Meristemomyces frigidus]|uniref:Uncharacterized protein n=1 Tax=Meristemomyces frigidus TaxID=1508187 RepID=A0AAN7YN12_9PEZI|nr:hypothetical protein LTR62_005100 [Meristemomyces frigidus]
MSSDALNPTGPAQPNLDQVYETQGNAATKEPAEKQTAQQNAHETSESRATDKRAPVPAQQNSYDQATPSALGAGITGAPPGEEAKGLTEEDVGRHKENDGDALAVYSEDKIAAANEEKSGASGAQPGLESDLDRKKEEQREAREEVQSKENKEFDVGGVLGQRGGPANPVDKGGYPNA